MEPDITGFSELLKKLRSERRLSLQQAADEIGITKSHLWGMELGSSSNPRIKTLVGISRTYGVDLGALSHLAAAACEGRSIPQFPRGSVPTEELEQWALKRADDAGRLARELMHYRRTKSAGENESRALDRALAFIEGLTADPLLVGDDIEMTLDDVQRHAKIELNSIRKAINLSKAEA